jgi:hypothetical protein
MRATRVLLSALLGCVTLVVLSCGDPSPLAVDPHASRSAQGDLLPPLPPPPTLPPLVPNLVRCDPLPYEFVSREIGAKGGRIRVGPHELWIPAGALDSAVTITAELPSSNFNLVRFQPEGLTFQRPAFLMMSYANCDPLAFLLPKRIAQVTDALDIIEYLLSLDHLPSQTVTGRLEHFSEYAIAW